MILKELMEVKRELARKNSLKINLSLFQTEKEILLFFKKIRLLIQILFIIKSSGQSLENSSLKKFVAGVNI